MLVYQRVYRGSLWWCAPKKNVIFHGHIELLEGTNIYCSLPHLFHPPHWCTAPTSCEIWAPQLPWRRLLLAGEPSKTLDDGCRICGDSFDAQPKNRNGSHSWGCTILICGVTKARSNWSICVFGQAAKHGSCTYVALILFFEIACLTLQPSKAPQWLRPVIPCG